MRLSASKKRPVSAVHWLRPLALVCTLLALGGCATRHPLMPTPHLYSERHARLFGELAPELRSSTIPVFFVTDRAPETREDGGFGYGHGRSDSMAYGEALVEIGEGLGWEDVTEASLVRRRSNDVMVEIREIRELGRTPPTPFPYEPRGGFYVHTLDVLADVEATEAHFHEEINTRLALTPRKEILLYVHGYNNDFRDAVLTWAGMWHFFGREGVPVVYSWPAGFGGLAGYAYDRESGEFTVYHLKLMLRALARNERIEGVRVLAHSRGTDVLTSALRELFIEARAAGVDPRERFRIRQVVLAAPDLDFDVTRQRLQSEPIGPGVEGVTVYVSPTDQAIGFAEWLFSSVKRIGTLQLRDVRASELKRIEAVDNLSVVELEGDGGSYGHAYFHENPAVSSDVLQVLRFDRAPGDGRPLEPQQAPFWRIRDDYLLRAP